MQHVPQLYWGILHKRQWEKEKMNTWNIFFFLYVEITKHHYHTKSWATLITIIIQLVSKPKGQTMEGNGPPPLPLPRDTTLKHCDLNIVDNNITLPLRIRPIITPIMIPALLLPFINGTKPPVMKANSCKTRISTLMPKPRAFTESFVSKAYF